MAATVSFKRLRVPRAQAVPLVHVDGAFREEDNLPSEPQDPPYQTIATETDLWNRDACLCGCTPALSLWVVNLVALVGHLSIATVVLVEGVPSYDNLDFQIYQLVPRWLNMTRDGYSYTVEESFVGRLNLVALCALFSLLSATSHAVVVFTTIWPSYGHWYYKSIWRCCVWFRWIEYSLSAPIMTLSLLLVGGVREFTAIVLTFVTQSATMVMGGLTEELGSPVSADGGERAFKRTWVRWVPFWTGVFLMLPSWIIFFYGFFDSVEKASARYDRRPPGWVYAVLFSQFFLFSTFTFPIAVFQLCYPPKKYWITELCYAILSLASKLTLNSMLLTNVLIIGRLDLSSD